ncbi:hypothetical protein WME94_26920 [Sorangium sp. So ce429]
MTLGLLCAACGDAGDPPGPGGGGSGGVGATTVSSSGGSGGSGGSGSGGSGGTGVGGDGAGGSSAEESELAAPAATFLHPTTMVSRVITTTIAAAPDGGAYAGGEGRGAVMLGDQTITEQGAFLIHLDRDGALRWSAPIVTTLQSAATTVTGDGSGNVLFAGEVKGDVKIGSTTLAGSPTYLDVMVAKLDGAGAVLWARRFGSVADDRSFAIATDATDHVYVGGNVFWEVDFGSGLMLAHGQSPFLLKLTPDGELAWAKVFDNPGGISGAVVGIATHDDGDVSITGYADRPLTIDGTELSKPAGSTMMGFIARFSSSGEIRLARRFGGPELDMGSEIAVGEGTFLAGTVSGESDVLGTTVNADIAGTPFVAKLTESGTAEWVITPEPGARCMASRPTWRAASTRRVVTRRAPTVDTAPSCCTRALPRRSRRPGGTRRAPDPPTAWRAPPTARSGSRASSRGPSTSERVPSSRRARAASSCASRRPEPVARAQIGRLIRRPEPWTDRDPWTEEEPNAN